MKNNELKELVNHIAREEKLYKLLIANNQIGIRKIKQVIKEIFKKYESYYCIEDGLLDAILYGKGVKTDKFDEVEKIELHKFNEFLQIEVMDRYWSIFNKSSIQNLTIFLIENRIDFFEKELRYNYDNIKCSRSDLEMIIEEAKSNTTINIIGNDKIDYYDRYITELNSSLECYLKEKNNISRRID